MVDLKALMVAYLKAHLEGVVIMAIPSGGSLLWKWFLDLNRTRTVHAAGVNPIQYTEIEAYSRFNRQAIEPRHVAILVAMDEAYLGFAHRGRNTAPEGVQSLPPISKAPLTAGLVDAMFGGT
ncbi:hypothetical protein A6U97_02475 [Agrobacterium tumefaciens]|uniref:phage tail assembly chaperone n=1 Tax=Agrobacterium tumefaciens TaxID=358 RepID=UPI00080F8CC6|nr:hypothetical protein A6U97_02475 [Agrobacterium tumefaciens]